MGSAQRRVYSEIVKLAATARTEIVLESPYFVLKKDGLAVFEHLIARGVRVHVLSNNLAATDAAYIVGSLFLNQRTLKKTGIDLSLVTGAAPKKYKNSTASPRWGLHAKRAVIDKQHLIIGTYNVDPRSANLNSELLLICRDNPTLAQAALENQKLRAEVAIPLGYKTIFYGADLGEIARLAIYLPLSGLFDFLL
jgi:putative cardiolipin synthase